MSERVIGINAMHVEVGVDFGDHGETVSRAVEVSRDETVGELVDRLLTKKRWSDDTLRAESMSRIELRAVMSVEDAKEQLR